jgi:hypothetical protein
MRTITKLIIITASVAAFASSAAFADNQQLQNRLALERQQAERNQKATTVAVYAGRQGISQQGERQRVRFERRWDAHGQFFGLYVPDNR